MMKRYLYALFGGLLSLGSVSWAAEGLRLNEIQVIGTHNSYHLAPEAPLRALIALGGKERAESLDYSHRPLAEQFSWLGIRQIELDVYADPKGGHYREPKALATLPAAVREGLEPVDPEGELLKPGLKVLHVSDFDYRTTVRTFVRALEQVRDWSDAHPAHVPILVLVEVKEALGRPGMTAAIPFDTTQLAEIDREIRSVFPTEKLLVPDTVRGNRATLRDAILEEGWPHLDAVRGKVLFALDNGGAVRDRYLEGNPTLEGRVLFVSVDADHPAAAFMKLNNPVGDAAKIRKAVKEGFLVRTRADSPTRHARANDTSQREAAFASGAQFVSTDYPEPNAEFSSYQVVLPQRAVARRNPLLFPNAEGGIDVEGTLQWRTLGPDQWTNGFAWGEFKWREDEVHLRSDRNFMLATRDRYGDFVLELEAWVPRGNSGVFFRCEPSEKKLLGYQAEIDLSERAYSGAVYDNTGRGFLFPKKDDPGEVKTLRARQGEGYRAGAWNRLRVECLGPRIRVWLNDRVVTDLVDTKHRGGVIGLQHHGGGGSYRFRQIRLLEL